MRLLRRYITCLIFRVRVIKTHSYLANRSKIYFERTVRFGYRCYFTARGGEISIGANSFLNAEVMLNADVGGRIFIDENCIIGPRVLMRTTNHNFENIAQVKSSQGHVVGDINISSNVWIGANATILSGINIGANSVIGAGAVVTKDIPANCLAVGVPARVIKNYE